MTEEALFPIIALNEIVTSPQFELGLAVAGGFVGGRLILVFQAGGKRMIDNLV